MSEFRPGARPDPLAQLLPDLADVGAPLEQAQGALMLLYGLTAGQALQVLTARAHLHGLDTLDLAAELVAAMPDLGGSAQLSARLDELLGRTGLPPQAPGASSPPGRDGPGEPPRN